MSWKNSGFKPPEELNTGDFRLRPITVTDAELDYDAVMESRGFLRLWEQSSWPEDDFTVEANRKDLAGLEKRHLEGYAYTYTVMNQAQDRSLGCVYIFPTSAKFLREASVEDLGALSWEEVDAVVYFWTRLTQMRLGMDERVLEVLRPWFSRTWKLQTTVYVTNEQYTEQLALLQGTDMTPLVRLSESGKPGDYLAFGKPIGL